VLERIVDVLAKDVVGSRRVPPRPDDPEVLGHQALAEEMKEAGEQLALGQIAGRTEQHEHPLGRAWKLTHALILGRHDAHATRRRAPGCHRMAATFAAG
jgi:hypothetical protein